jgi:hypothetical protein
MVFPVRPCYEDQDVTDFPRRQGAGTGMWDLTGITSFENPDAPGYEKVQPASGR